MAAQALWGLKPSLRGKIAWALARVRIAPLLMATKRCGRHGHRGFGPFTAPSLRARETARSAWRFPLPNITQR